MKPATSVNYSALQRDIERAVQLIGAGKPGAAMRLLRDVNARTPNTFDVLHMLGIASTLDGRLEDGIRHLLAAAQLKPQSPAVWVNLGGAYEKAGQLEQAADAYASALRSTPDLAEASHKRTLVLLEMGRLDEAAAQADGFAERYYANDTARVSVGIVQARQGRMQEAVESFRRAVEIAPGNALANANLGFALATVRDYAEAATVLKDVVARQPADLAALERLVHARRQVADWEGIEAQQQALSKAARGSAPVSPWGLFAITGEPDVLRRAAVATVAAKIPRLPEPTSPANGYVHDRVRIAYVYSSEIGHPSRASLAALVAGHDRQAFEVFGMSYAPAGAGPSGDHLRRAFDTFDDMAGKDPEAIAHRLREHEIDIAIDLTGPADDGMPQCLAFRPAPVQVSVLGFPGTTGAPWIDYVIADAVTVPAGDERHYTEQIVRLPGSAVPTPPPHAKAELASKGARDARFVFACLSDTWKITPELFAVWSRLLKDVDGSVLKLLPANAMAMENLKSAAMSHGLGAERLIFASSASSGTALRDMLGSVDLCLDTSPFADAAGTASALSIGIPVITLASASFASRTSASLLSAAGLRDLVTTDLAAYEAKAKSLAGDPANFDATRAALQAGRTRNPLYDIASYVRHLEAALRVMHERARKGQRHAPITISQRP